MSGEQSREEKGGQRRVLLLVPHEDDELLIGGPMLVNLCRSGYEVYVYIATNGDYYPFESAQRAHESLEALALMGVAKDHVIFGGYGDDWQGKSLYDSAYREAKTSAAGFTQTHGPAEGIEEWHFVRTKEHAPYTKEAYLEDLRSLVDALRPEVLISVGFDAHPDHRALYLLTLEALALLYEEDANYTPAFLEKFAYGGNLFGRRDFFRFPHVPSAPPYDDIGVAFNDWESRIRYRVPEDCNSVFLRSSLLFQALRCYRSQPLWMDADRIINADTVYWQRNTANRLLGAEITASSGEVRWLNDHKLIEPVSTAEECCDLTSLCFRPEAADEKKTVRVALKEPAGLRVLLLYFNTPGGISAEVVLTLLPEEGGEQIIRRMYESERDFSILRFDLDGRSLRGLSLRFKNVRGNLGLGEIEALEKEPRVPFEEFLVGTEEGEAAGTRCGAPGGADDGEAAGASGGASADGINGLRGICFSLLLTFVLQFERLFFKLMKLPYKIRTFFDRRKARFDRTRAATAVPEKADISSAEPDA